MEVSRNGSTEPAEDPSGRLAEASGLTRSQSRPTSQAAPEGADSVSGRGERPLADAAVEADPAGSVVKEQRPTAAGADLLVAQTNSDVQGESTGEQPREGTLLWLQARTHVEVLGEMLPDVHRIPEGSQLHPERDGMCRVVRPSGERCRAPGTKLYGVCLVHLGGGLQDASELGKLGNAAKARMKARRSLLGIGARRVGSARSHARLAALERAEEIAAALVDGPLDDAELGSLQRQLAALRILDAVEPVQSVSLEIEVASADDVQGLGWVQLQAMAARMLGEEDEGSQGVPMLSQS